MLHSLKNLFLKRATLECLKGNWESQISTIQPYWEFKPFWVICVFKAIGLWILDKIHGLRSSPLAGVWLFKITVVPSKKIIILIVWSEGANHKTLR